MDIISTFFTVFLRRSMYLMRLRCTGGADNLINHVILLVYTSICSMLILNMECKNYNQIVLADFFGAERRYVTVG